MQVTFNPRDPNQVADVLVMLESIGALRDYAPETVDHIPDDICAAAPSDPVDPAAAFGADLSPAPAPAPTVPAAPTPQSPTAVPPSSVVDAKGVPWDERIHSGPADKKPMNADNTWRRKRGVDDATVAAVMAEIAPNAGAAPAPIPAPPAPPATPAVAATEFGPDVAATAGDVPPPPPVAVDAAPLTFASLMKKVTGLQTAGLLTVEETREIAGALGIESVRDLLKRPDLLEPFDALLPVAV